MSKMLGIQINVATRCLKSAHVSIAEYVLSLKGYRSCFRAPGFFRELWSSESDFNANSKYIQFEQTPLQYMITFKINGIIITCECLAY